MRRNSAHGDTFIHTTHTKPDLWHCQPASFPCSMCHLASMTGSLKAEKEANSQECVGQNCAAPACCGTPLQFSVSLCCCRPPCIAYSPKCIPILVPDTIEWLVHIWHWLLIAKCRLKGFVNATERIMYRQSQATGSTTQLNAKPCITGRHRDLRGGGAGFWGPGECQQSARLRKHSPAKRGLHSAESAAAGNQQANRMRCPPLQQP